MSIHLHIERLILHGITLPRRARAMFADALQDELGHLLTRGGLSPELQGGIALPHVSASVVRLGATTSPGDLGRQVARAVYARIGEPGPRGEPG